MDALTPTDAKLWDALDSQKKTFALCRAGCGGRPAPWDVGDTLTYERRISSCLTRCTGRYQLHRYLTRTGR
jgi:hypothetical protein